MPKPTCVSQLLLRKNEQAAQAAYGVRSEGSYHAVTWGAYGDLVVNMAQGFIALGLEARQCVAILSYNRIEWSAACMAAQMANSISAGVYVSASAEEVAYVIEHCEATILLVENETRLRTQVLPNIEKFTHLKKIVLMSGSPSIHDDKCITMLELINLGKRQSPEEFEARRQAIDADDAATLIYTSGTTGHPKAVMLSHAAIYWTVRTTVSLLSVGKGDSMVSYLPMAHIAEQMFSVYAPIVAGIMIYFAESLERLPENLKEVEPTIFFGVPRVYEKFQEKISQKLAEQVGAKSKLIAWARGVSTDTWAKRHNAEVLTTLDRFQYGLAGRIVFQKLKKALGFGRTRLCVSGAAPISREIISFFTSLDLPIYEVYGQSEGSGPTSFATPAAARIGTVGRPLPGVEVKIAQDGEILIRGPNLFMGYYKDIQATAEALADGWMRSGDVGHLDHSGYLSITDRKKDILITSGGKNVSPQNIESMLKQIPMVSLAVVVGDQRKYLVALLTPNMDSVLQFAKDQGLIAQDPKKILKDNCVLSQIRQDIEKVNARLAPVEQVKNFALLDAEFSIENGELTPTMKLKRKAIQTRYRETIDTLYAQSNV
jgi:long-chain acyl-CoA synthetase